MERRKLLDPAREPSVHGKNDGTIDYELCHTDYSKKIDGVTASDVSNAAYAGNAMATIPLIWVKRYTEDNKQYHLFCDTQLDDDFTAGAFTRADGSIEPYTFYPMFAGSLISNKLRSIAGQGQMNSQTGTNEITYAKNNGALWNTGYFSIVQLRWELETLFTGSTNKQDACGYGNYTGGTQASNLSRTGTLLTGGRFYGYGSKVNKPRKFMHCEQQAGAWERINGLLYVGGKVLRERIGTVQRDWRRIYKHRAFNVRHVRRLHQKQVMTKQGCFPTELGGQQ